MSENLKNKIITILASVFFALLYLMQTDLNKNTGIINIFVVVLPFIIFLFKSSSNGYKFRIIIEPFHWYMIIFGSYCCLTSIWASDSSSSIVMGLRVFKVLIYLSVFWLAFQNNESIIPLLKGAMFGGFIVGVIFVLFEGVEGIITYIINSKRLENDFINANSLGMMCSTSILINLFFLIGYKSGKELIPFSVLSIVLVGISASRKALAILIIGIVLLFWFYSIRQRKITLKKIFKSIGFPLFVFVTLVIVLSNSSFFSVMGRRMGTLINAFTGEGSVDGSASIRFSMNKFGLNIFYENPIVGIGIDNSKYLVGRKFGRYFYLHNNYTELLACSGLIGFISFYSFYFYLICGFIKYRRHKNRELFLCLILIFISFVIDYGCVTYESPNTYYYILMFYLQLKIMRKSL